MKTDNNAYLIHSNYLETPSFITDTEGNMLWSMQMSAYGQAIINADVDGDGHALELPLRFPGQYADAETGLYYNVNRYYDPVEGRYITRDPLGMIDGPNVYVYAYAGNGPINFIDPKGLWSTGAHNAIIDQFGTQNGFSGSEISYMQAGSAYADSALAGFQGSDFAYMHAMTSETIPDKGQACKMTNQFIQDKLARYNRYKNLATKNRLQSGYYNKIAHRELGMAMHAVMDSTSPAHADFAL